MPHALFYFTVNSTRRLLKTTLIISALFIIFTPSSFATSFWSIPLFDYTTSQICRAALATVMSVDPESTFVQTVKEEIVEVIVPPEKTEEETTEVVAEGEEAAAAPETIVPAEAIKPEEVITKKITIEIVYLFYQPDDFKQKRHYICKLDGENRVLLGSYKKSWETHKKTTHITYAVKNDQLEINDRFSDLSSLKKSYNREQLRAK